MLARPEHTNWAKALASWTCPPQTGSCDDICGDGVSRAAPSSCRLRTAAPVANAAERYGPHSPHRLCFALLLQPWSVWEHVGCRGPRQSFAKYGVSRNPSGCAP
jgi:hypothetical protein